MRTTRILVGVLVVMGLGVLPVSAMDLSDYRQDTYGPPNHYCNPTRSLSSNGAGTLADPWNMAQCAALPVAGDVVGIMPGISVDLPTTNNSRIPAFQPANTGTANNRIVYVTRFAAVALSNVESNPNRTEFRHNGGPPRITNGVGTGDGAPMIGANGRNYITFDGFYVHMAEAYPREDSGVIRAESSIGIHFRNFVIRGTTLTCASNCVIYRPNNARDTVLSNFRAYDFVNDPTGSATPQAALFSDQYGDQNVLIENFEIRNIARGIYFKGTVPAGVNFNYGTVRYGIVSNTDACFRFNDLDPNQLTTVEYNLCYDVSGEAGIALSSETSPARNILIHHNTVARVDSSNINTHGGLYTRARGLSGTNVVIRDNIIDISSGPFGHGMDLAETTVLPNTLNYNGYTKNGATLTFAFNGVQYNSLAAWRTAVSRDLNSVQFSSSPFINRAGGDFRIASGHQARTASSTGGELGAFAGARLPGVDTGGGEGSGGGEPTAPTNLRIVP